MSHVKEFDTKTKEAIVYVYLKYNDGSRIILQSDDNVDNNLYALSPDLSNRKMKVAEIKIKLPKHDAYNKKTGEKIV